MKATFIKDIEGWRGDVRLYRVEPPMEYLSISGDKQETDYVIVSAVEPHSDPGMDFMSALVGLLPGVSETFIFPSLENGEPINMAHLEGSFQGEKNHAKALSNAGYTVVAESEQR